MCLINVVVDWASRFIQTILEKFLDFRLNTIFFFFYFNKKIFERKSDFLFEIKELTRTKLMDEESIK